MPDWLINYLDGLDFKNILILNRLFSENENTQGLLDRVANEFPEEGEVLLSEEEEEAAKTAVIEAEAEKMSGPITEADKQSIAEKLDIPIDDARLAVLDAENQDLVGTVARERGLDDPSGSTTWLVNDAYLNATMNPVTFTFTESVVPFGKGSSGQFMRGSQEFPGMLGTTDIQFYAARPQVEGGGRGSPTGSKPEFLSWTYDKRKLPDGYVFIAVEQENVPFTISDALGIYDKQDEKGKRLISQALALGNSATGSFLLPVLGREMFSNPDSIYDRDVVEAGMMQMATAASVRASQLDGGFAALGDRFNPTSVLDQPDSLGSFQNDLFDMAVDANLVTQITKDYGRDLAERALINLTGLRDVTGFGDMVDTWIEDIQRETMGRSTALSQSEIQAGFETRIEQTPELQPAIQASNRVTAQQALGMAIKNANRRTP